MNKRRTKKAVAKWYGGRPLTQLELQAVKRWHRRTMGRIGVSAFQAAESIKRMARALDAFLYSFADIQKEGAR